jgi:uncharacterized membrane protein
MDPSRLAQGLGWFSIGLGLAEILAPRAVARTVGTRNHTGLMRFYGLRELMAGVGILTQNNPAPWLWARVAGDMLDLTSLGSALSSPKNNRGLTAFGIASVAGVTALDVLCARELSGPMAGGETVHAEANVIVNRSPEECYAAWRNLANMPRFMEHVREVRVIDDRRSHWVGGMEAGGPTIEWDSEITQDVPNERIDWSTVPGAQITHSGSIEFERAPGNRGTYVRIQMDYSAPAVSIAAGLAKMIGKEPEQMAHKNLRRFKQFVETGNVITTEGQSAGRRSGATWLDEIAR